MSACQARHTKGQTDHLGIIAIETIESDSMEFRIFHHCEHSVLAVKEDNSQDYTKFKSHYKRKKGRS